MSESNTGESTDKDADTTGKDQHGGTAHNSDIPEESPASQSDVSLSQQVADREPESGKSTT